MTKVALITGAGQGIGLAVAQKMAENNIKVLINDIDFDLAENATKLINQNFPDMASYYAGDCSDPNFIKSMIKFTLKKFDRIDIVVANAGITRFGKFLEFTPQDFEDVMNLNLRGTFFLIQYASKYMIKNQINGRMILMSSVVGHQAHVNLAAYAMSKAAIEMLAKNLVIELSKYKIRINCVAPGATLTERTVSDPQYQKIWSEITPLGNPALTQDIAEAVFFLSSDNSKQITGQTLIVDGGWTSVGVQPQ